MGHYWRIRRDEIVIGPRSRTNSTARPAWEECTQRGRFSFCARKIFGETSITLLLTILDEYLWCDVDDFPDSLSRDVEEDDAIFVRRQRRPYEKARALALTGGRQQWQTFALARTWIRSVRLCCTHTKLAGERARTTYAHCTHTHTHTTTTITADNTIFTVTRANDGRKILLPVKLLRSKFQR